MDLAKWDLAKWLRPSGTKRAAAYLLDKVVTQARDPRFYTDAGVADTLDGRFDMIVAHLVVVMHRLKSGSHERLSQTLFDAFFENMDDSLREMGVGDMAVPKRIKAMSEAFYGRIEAYDAPLTDLDAEALAAALLRNVYRGAPETDETKAHAALLGGYLVETARALQTHSGADFEAGRIAFPAFTGK